MHCGRSQDGWRCWESGEEGWAFQELCFFFLFYLPNGARKKPQAQGWGSGDPGSSPSITIYQVNDSGNFLRSLSLSFPPGVRIKSDSV